MWLLALFIVLVVITSKRKRELSAFVTEKKKKNSPKCAKADRESESCQVWYCDSFQYLRSGEGAFKTG